MDGDIDAPLGQRLLQLLDEEPLAADLGERGGRQILSPLVLIGTISIARSGIAPPAAARTIAAWTSASLLAAIRF